MKTLIVTVLLLGSVLAEAVTVKEALRNLIVDCPEDASFDKCLELAVKIIRESVVSGVTDAIGGDGTMPEQKFGGISVSGTDITLSGLDTVDIQDTKLDGNMLTATIKIGELSFDGHLVVDLPVIGKIKIHLKLKLSGLMAKLKLVLGVKDGKLVVKDIQLQITVEELSVVVNNGKPLTKADGSPLTGIAGSVAKTILRGLNNKRVLEKRLIPMVLRVLKPFILKTINERIAKLPTLK